MTPAQQRALAVALDGLREHEVDPADVVRALYDEATAGRMLRAAVAGAAVLDPEDMATYGSALDAITREAEASMAKRRLPRSRPARR